MGLPYTGWTRVHYVQNSIRDAYSSGLHSFVLFYYNTFAYFSSGKVRACTLGNRIFVVLHSVGCNNYYGQNDLFAKWHAQDMREVLHYIITA